MQDHFKWCKYAELDYAAYKIAVFLCGFLVVLAINLFPVKKRIKNSRKLCIFPPEGDRNRELKQNTSAVIDTSGFSVLLFCVHSRGHHQGPVPEREVQPP